MTTRITVTTDSGGLLDRNAQQQAAARQAALLKAQAEKAAASGEAQLRQDRINAGLDPATGRPLPSTGSTLSRVDQQPAAFRRSSGLSYVMVPNTGDSDEILVASKPIDPAIVYNTLGVSGPVSVFPADGPQNYNSWGAEETGNNNVAGIVKDPSHPTNLAINALEVGLTEEIVPGYTLYQPPQPTKNPISKFKSFTIEFYFRIRDTNVFQGGEIASASFHGIEISLGRGLDFQRGYLSDLEVRVGGIVPDSPTAGSFVGATSYWRLRGSNGYVISEDALTIPPFGDGWNHIAFVKNNSLAFVALNGTTLATAQFYANYNSRYAYMSEGFPIVGYYSPVGSLFPVLVCRAGRDEGQNSRIHGLRWTGRALYTTSPFTPPPAIFNPV